MPMLCLLVLCWQCLFNQCCSGHHGKLGHGGFDRAGRLSGLGGFRHGCCRHCGGGTLQGQGCSQGRAEGGGQPGAGLTGSAARRGHS